MCGIVGYIGEKQAAPLLLEGLEKLEYRGYDSAGIAVFDGKDIHMAKASGRLRVLRELTEDGSVLKGTAGIGHTRWATHGSPTDVNAHPHFNSDSSIAVVHNGIIENYLKLKRKLEGKGYSFLSETDTEVIVHLLDYHYRGDPVETITKVMHRMEGSYALGIIFRDHPGEIYAVRKDSPLIVGAAGEGNFIASDVPAVLKYTRQVYFLENEEIARLTGNLLEFFNIDGELITKEVTTVDWDMSAAEKGGYEYFMLKEIYEQPKAAADTLNPRLDGNRIRLEELHMTDEEIRAIRKIYMVGCGSAYHTAMTAKYVMEGLARIPVEVDLASEFRYRNPILDRDTLVVAVSQSGETADTLAALREAGKQGVRTLGIVNVVGSSIAREADSVLYTWAGPEIAVATTKAYSTQLIVHYLLAMKFAQVRGTVDPELLVSMTEQLRALPDQMKELLEEKERVQKLASRYLATEHVFFIGRGIDYAISLEGSLKLKEISYIHSEAYAAGELKHGTISLIEEDTLVTAVITQEDLYKKTLSNVQEVKTRGAYVLSVTNKGHSEVEKMADYVLYLPETNKYFTNSLAIIPLQLFSYYVSLGKGLDVDKPRNLAKSVTVE